MSGTRTITLSAMIPGSREDCETCCACADGVVDAAVTGDLDGAAEYLRDFSAHIEQDHGQ